MEVWVVLVFLQFFLGLSCIVSCVSCNLIFNVKGKSRKIRNIKIMKETKGYRNKRPSRVHQNKHWRFVCWVHISWCWDLMHEFSFFISKTGSYKYWHYYKSTVINNSLKNKWRKERIKKEKEQGKDTSSRNKHKGQRNRERD